MIFLSKTLESSYSPPSAMILKLTSQKQDLEQIFKRNLPNLSERRKDGFYEDGDIPSLQLMQKYNLDTTPRLQFALAVLTHQNDQLIKTITADLSVTKQIIYQDTPRDITLSVYSFKHGNFELIRHLLDNHIVKPIEYNHSLKDHMCCINDLDISVLNNYELQSTKQTAIIRSMLKEQRACTPPL